MFAGEIEASKIPPHWHAWLHKSIDVPPIDYTHKYVWQKNHKQNMTGTNEAYFPSSHPLSKNYNDPIISRLIMNLGLLKLILIIFILLLTTVLRPRTFTRMQFCKF